MKRLAAAALVVGAVLATSVSTAWAATFNSTDNGHYGSDGAHGTTNTNIITGSLDPHRNFATFDLTSSAGLTAISATLTYFADNGDYQTGDSTETFETFDYVGDISALVGGSAGVTGYNDLGSGISFGETIVSTPGASGSMPAVVVNLNAASVAALNSLLSSSSYIFAIGGSCTTCSSSGTTLSLFQWLWGFSDDVPAAQLDVVFAPLPAPVPIPAALPLLMSALGFFGFMGWRCKRLAAA